MSYLMQGNLSAGGAVVAWITDAPDFTGADYPGGPGLVNVSTISARVTSVGGSGAALSDDDPVALGSEEPGVATAASRADHVHPPTGLVPTSREVAGAPLSSDVTAATIRSAILAVDPGIPATGLVIDWRASALGLADGDPVGSWAPSTGTGTLTGSGGTRPTYRATGSPAGTPAVEFDNTSSTVLTLATVGGLPTGADPGTVVAIVSRLRPVGGAGLQHLWQYGFADALQARGLAVTNVDNLRTHDWSGGVTETRSPRGQDVRIIAHVFDGTLVSLFVDGVDYGSAEIALNTGSASGFALGSNLVNGEFGSYRLMRLFGYSRVLGARDWIQIKDHARVAYGIQ